MTKEKNCCWRKKYLKKQKQLIAKVDKRAFYSEEKQKMRNVEFLAVYLFVEVVFN